MSKLSMETIEMLAMCGIVALAGMLFFIFACLYMRVKEEIVYLIKQYKDKHFMDKPPKCKCYCIQCEHWKAFNSTRETGACSIWEKWTSKDETCTRGRLRTKEEYKNDEIRTEKNTAV